MAYEKQTWANGDVITAEKLNHMEDGIEDAYELPAVTETDNGKVLGVENGQFGLVDGVEIVDVVQTGTDSTTGKPLINFSYDDLGRIIQKYNNGKAVVRLQLLPNSSLNYYMGGDPRLYVDAFYATSSSMTGDRYVLHAHSTSVYNVSAHAIRIYDITLEVGRSSNSLAIEAIQISNQ